MKHGMNDSGLGLNQDVSSNMLQATVRDIAVTGDGSAFVALIEVETGELVPVAIGQPEAMSIAMAKNGEVPLRPSSHDLLVSVFAMVNAKLKRIEITSLEDGIYYSKLILEHRGIVLEIDARPSDAMAVAVRLQAPIFIDAQVVELSGMTEFEEISDEDDDENEDDNNTLLGGSFDTVKA